MAAKNRILGIENWLFVIGRGVRRYFTETIKKLAALMLRLLQKLPITIFRLTLFNKSFPRELEPQRIRANAS